MYFGETFDFPLFVQVFELSSKRLDGTAKYNQSIFLATIDGVTSGLELPKGYKCWVFDGWSDQSRPKSILMGPDNVSEAFGIPHTFQNPTT